MAMLPDPFRQCRILSVERTLCHPLLEHTGRP